MIESRVNSKLSVNVSNMSRVWLGNLYKQRKPHNFPPILISKFILHLKVGCQLLLVLVGLPARIKLYPGNSKLPLSDEILESK